MTLSWGMQQYRRSVSYRNGRSSAVIPRIWLW